MALKLQLKPDERVILGGAVIRNGRRASELWIENNVPILREKDILPEEAADTPARRIYFAVQLMYIDAENRPAHIESFFSLAQDLMEAAASTRSHILAICEQVAVSSFYQALKTARNLIDYEEELISHVEPVHSRLRAAEQGVHDTEGAGGIGTDQSSNEAEAVPGEVGQL